MKIDYEKFNKYSERSQLRIIAFARLLLSMIEIYNESEIPLSDFEKESFSLEEACSLIKKLNEIIDNTITEFYGDSNAVGPMNNRTLETYIYIKGRPETCSIISSFLENIEDNKTLLIINKKTKRISQKLNPELSYSFRSPSGKSKRFEYLLAIVNSEENIAGKKLDPKVKPQTLSGEIANINTNLKKALKLKKEIIINHNNSGYGANRYFYDFEIV